MSNRRKRAEAVDNIQDLSGLAEDNFESDMPSEEAVPLQQMSTTEAANVLYGSQVANDPLQKPLRASPTPINRIFPDPAQPRRTIPYDIRTKYWQSGSPAFDEMAHLFSMWLREAKLERDGEAINLEAYLEGTVTERAPADLDEGIPSQSDAKTQPQSSQRLNPGPAEASLMQVIDLAANIRKHGLMNPITIAPHVSGYMLETGERRWLSYHLLYWYDVTYGSGVSEYESIHARRVDHVDIWRQASENNARNDLNSIGKARQLARLIMDLYQDRKGYRFKPYEAFDADRRYYAQVQDGTAFRIPHGQVERVVNAMGFKNAVQVRQYRSLLRLPDVIWNIADDLNWSENAIQKDILQPSKNDDEKIRRAMRMAQRDGYPVSELTEYESYWAPSQLERDLMERTDMYSGLADRDETGSLGKFSVLIERYSIPALERDFAKLGISERERILFFLDSLTRTLHRKQEEIQNSKDNA